MTIIKQKNQRVAIFIDTQNLYHSARNLYGANVNFKNILKDALGNRALIRAIAYVITTESKDESPFFEALEKAGIETKTKDLQIFFGGAKKADWDVGIAIDAIRLAPKVDAIVIVSGDGDFVPLVEYLKFSTGVQIEVMSFLQSSSAKLLEATDHFTDLSINKSKYLIYKNKKQKPKIKKDKVTIIENKRKK
ncbi:MAG: NYN domain-containing protein [Candidatus Pacebacteria bacterium]|nr:NYN domain-containing protein [Candidatus Paceibacterota bacterium]